MAKSNNRHDAEWELGEWRKMALKLAKILDCIPVAEEIIYQTKQLKQQDSRHD